MVKTPRGRIPGRRHERIVKKLRHRRRMAQLVRDLEQITASTPDTVSTATSSWALSRTPSTTSFVDGALYNTGFGLGGIPDLETLSASTAAGVNEDDDVGVLERSRELDEEEEQVEDAPHRLYFADSEVNCLSTYDESEQNTPAAAAMVAFKKMSNRGASESEAVVLGGNGAKNFDRPSVSESGLHDAIPMPPPSTPNEDVQDAQYRGGHSGERLQHTDEETDRYLSHLFTPSIANITTTVTTVAGEVDTRSDEFQRLRNLFSTVTSDNTSSTRPETLPGLLRHYSSHDTGTYGLRSLFESGHHQDGEEEAKFKPGLPPSSMISEQSLGLNTLFNNNTRTVAAENAGISSCQSSTMGLRTLFEEDEGNVPESTASTLGLRTLFNQDEQEGQQIAPQSTASTLGLRTLFNQSEDDQQEGAGGNMLRSTASTLGLRTLFLHDKKDDEALLKSTADMPTLKSSASLLGNLFGSEHTIHGAADPRNGREEDEALSAKERMKVLIAQDLAQYLDDGQRSSSSLSTFVQQIDNLFANYRLAVKQIERLEKEFARKKKDQSQKE